jgi:ribosome-binding factor A
MRNRRRRFRGDDAPPFVDPMFAEALAGKCENKNRRSARKDDYRALMLCRQVQRVLSLSLADATVVDVTPAPDCSRLLVHVAIPEGVSPLDTLARLHERTPALRAEVARAITRKRAPELAFALSAPIRMEVRDEH